MRHNGVLLTGGSGKLGQAIIKSGYFPKILAPSHKELDITQPKTVRRFLERHDFGVIIHCAAFARMAECEKHPIKAINTNIIGTCNLVMETYRKKSRKNNSIRFIYISTDGVYPGIRGNYSENDETIPYNTYGWTKLGGECAVKTLYDYCIIRTSFFDKDSMGFDASPTDSYSSKMPVMDLVNAIKIILNSNFIGTINIGSDRKSDYERYKQFKPSLKPCKLRHVIKGAGINMASDSSLNLDLWKKLNRKVNKRNIKSMQA